MADQLAEAASLDEVEDRAVDTYVRRVDASRTVFTESEANTARPALDGIFDRMKKGEVARQVIVFD